MERLFKSKAQRDLEQGVQAQPIMPCFSTRDGSQTKVGCVWAGARSPHFIFLVKGQFVLGTKSKKRSTKYHEKSLNIFVFVRVVLWIACFDTVTNSPAATRSTNPKLLPG